MIYDKNGPCWGQKKQKKEKRVEKEMKRKEKRKKKNIIKNFKNIYIYIFEKRKKWISPAAFYLDQLLLRPL